MSQITAVTFDLWQTLLLDNRGIGPGPAQLRLEGTRHALKRAGENYSIEHLREAYRACYRHCHRVREDNLDVSFSEQVDIFINYVSPGLADRLPKEIVQEITQAYSDAFFVHPSPSSRRKCCGAGGNQGHGSKYRSHLQHRNDPRYSLPQISGTA